jgi:hypothetical protein
MLGRRAPCVEFRDMVSLQRLRLTILTCLLLLLAAPAQAATVAMVRPAKPSAGVTEILSRLQGELLSVGIEVQMLGRPDVRGSGPPDRRARPEMLERLVADREVDAVIDVVGDVVPVAVDVWLVDRSTRKLTVARVDAEPNAQNPSERLAIRALEVLRSSFLEFDLAARQRRGESIENPAARLGAEGVSTPAGPDGRLAVEAGAAALTGLDGVGAAVLPVLRLGWVVRPWLALQATLAGLGTRPAVARSAGTARIAQQYGVLGGSYRFRSGQGLWPFVDLSAGVLRTAITGQADSPRQGHTVDQWSFLVDGSLGAGLSLGRHYYLTLAAHVHVAAPYVAVHFADDVVATSGRPNLLFTLTVGAWL